MQQLQRPGHAKPHAIKQLEADGWELRGVRGSHHIFKHPIKPGHISVPHPKELGVGITHKLLKQAELD
jgi:predicted RNA binding protein YcfA (HicA-like mRNA interferase family)